jgi:hypothetical protein
VENTVAGNGALLYLGYYKNPGTYKVTSLNKNSKCIKDMNNSSTITVWPKPSIDEINHF